MDLLSHMSVFVAVADARSFRRAAQSLNMPTSTLSRRISLLEHALGLRLFNRTTRKLEPTEAGLLYYERCKNIVEQAMIAHENIGRMAAEPAGTLRVSLPVDFASTYLAPHIAAFANLHPALRFELDLAPRNVDLVAEPYDLAIRMGELDDSGLVAQVIARLTPRLFASPGYLETNGRPQSPTDLSRLDCIDLVKVRAWTLENGSMPVRVEIGGRFRLNNIGMMRRLAVLDMGIVLLPQEIVQSEVDLGYLLPVLPDWKGRQLPVNAVTESKLVPSRAKQFIQFLKENLKAH